MTSLPCLVGVEAVDEPRDGRVGVFEVVKELEPARRIVGVPGQRAVRVGHLLRAAVPIIPRIGHARTGRGDARHPVQGVVAAAGGQAVRIDQQGAVAVGVVGVGQPLELLHFRSHYTGIIEISGLGRYPPQEVP